MPSPPIIINLGDLSKPATVLIEKISDAVGGIFEPSQIRRVAHANADAAIIAAEAQIEINELQRRGIIRMIKEEGERQENIENITARAIPDLNSNAKPEALEKDWLANFFDKGRLISESEMQSLWARVLAGEANTPGSFSKRTVNLMASIDKRDADMFTKLCGYSWELNTKSPLIYEPDNIIYTQCGLTFGALVHLDSIGLITLNSLPGYQLQNVGSHVPAIYFGKVIVLEMPQNQTAFPIGGVLLTEAGRQLATICKPLAVTGFIEYTIDVWMRRGLIPFSPWMPKKAA